MTHELKCLPTFFRALHDGTKRFELRRNDRCFEVGDQLRIREYGPASGYSGRELAFSITYILRGGDFDLPDEMCILSLGEPVRPVPHA